MVENHKRKFADFCDKIAGLNNEWISPYVTFQETDKMFIAKYEPEYPLPSENDKIIIYSLSSDNYMLFGQVGVSCKFNGRTFEELKQYITEERLRKFGGE